MSGPTSRHVGSDPARNTAARHQCPNDPNHSRENRRAFGSSPRASGTRLLFCHGGPPCRAVTPANRRTRLRLTAAAGSLGLPTAPSEDRTRFWACSKAATVGPTISDLAERQAARWRTARCGEVSRPEPKPGPAPAAAAADSSRPSSVTAQYATSSCRTGDQRTELRDRLNRWRSQLLERRDRPLTDGFLVAARLHQVDGRHSPLHPAHSAAPQPEPAPRLACRAVVVLALSHRTCVGPRNPHR